MTKERTIFYFINRTIFKNLYSVIEASTGDSIGSIKKIKQVYTIHNSKTKFKNIDAAAKYIYKNRIQPKQKEIEIQKYIKNQVTMFKL